MNHPGNFFSIGRNVRSGTCAPFDAIISTSATPAPQEANRVKRIADVLRSAGARRVTLSNQLGTSRRLVRALTNLVYRPDILLHCDSAQIHLSVDHVQKVVRACKEAEHDVRLTTANSVFATNAGLYFTLEATWTGRKQEFVKIIECDEHDVFSAYKVFSDLAVPNLFIIELNSTCNFKCGYCPFHSDNFVDDPRYVGPKSGQEMDIDDFEKLICEVASWRDPFFDIVPTVAPFSRGEFFLAKNWLKALQIIKTYKLRSYVCSNASVLNKDILKQIFEDKLLDHFTISVDAFDADINFLTRRNKKFKKIELLIELASKLKRTVNSSVYFQINCTLSDANANDHDVYVHRWVDKADVLCIGPKHVINRHTKHSSYQYAYSPFGEDNGVSTELTPCTTLFRTIEVQCDGSLTLCAACGSERIKIGNVLKDGIAETRKRSHSFNAVAGMFSSGGSNNHHPYCSGCKMYKEHFHRRVINKDLEYVITPAAWTVKRLRQGIKA